LEWSEGFVVRAVGELALAELMERPRCAFCGGVGRRIQDGLVHRCRCQRLPDRIARFNAARIPARHHDSTLESFRPSASSRHILAAVRKWVDGYRPGAETEGLVLHGEPGRGKTHLLCGALRELVFRHGASVRFIEFSHLIALMKEAFGRRGEAVAVSPLVQVPVLAVDELGKGRGTDFELAVIDEIVTRRYNARGTLLATTNFPLKATAKAGEGANQALPGQQSLAERIGPRTFSRLAETVKFFELGGEDWRVTKGRA
jgi:DNA replication protein DnaC